MYANEASALESRESAMLAQRGSVLVRHRKLESVVARRIAECLRQGQPSMHLGLALGVREESSAVPLLARGIVETGRRARPEQRRERVADAAAAVHLQREIERRSADRAHETLERRC